MKVLALALAPQVLALVLNSLNFKNEKIRKIRILDLCCVWFAFVSLSNLNKEITLLYFTLLSSQCNIIRRLYVSARSGHAAETAHLVYR